MLLPTIHPLTIPLFPTLDRSAVRPHFAALPPTTNDMNMAFAPPLGRTAFRPYVPSTPMGPEPDAPDPTDNSDDACQVQFNDEVGQDEDCDYDLRVDSIFPACEPINVPVVAPTNSADSVKDMLATMDENGVISMIMIWALMSFTVVHVMKVMML